METVNNPGKLQTVICTLGELPTMDERQFCETLYDLTEADVLPTEIYEDALHQVNTNMAYTITDESDPVNKIRSWIDCLRFLNKYLTDDIITQICDVNICFEYRLKNRWVDAVIVCEDKIIILEFKSGTTTTESELLKYISQVNKYYNRMSHRNRAIVEAINSDRVSVEKYLVFTNPIVIGQVEREDYVLTGDSFFTVIDSITVPCPRNMLDAYLDTTSFFDPSITGAFLSLLTTGVVNYVLANNQNVEACHNIINSVLRETNRELGIILVTPFRFFRYVTTMLPPMGCLTA